VSVRNAITKLELSMGLEKVKSSVGAFAWVIKEQQPISVFVDK